MAFPLILLMRDFVIIKFEVEDYEQGSHIPYNKLRKVPSACVPVSVILHMTGFSSASFKSGVD